VLRRRLREVKAFTKKEAAALESWRASPGKSAQGTLALPAETENKHHTLRDLVSGLTVEFYDGSTADESNLPKKFAPSAEASKHGNPIKSLSTLSSI